MTLRLRRKHQTTPPATFLGKDPERPPKLAAWPFYFLTRSQPVWRKWLPMARVVISIIALHGASKTNLFDIVPAFTKAKLFRRDRFTCAYCGQRFHERELSCEHIVPQSRGGRWIWMNLCRRRLNSEPPCRLNIEPGAEAGSELRGCGQV